MLRDLTRPVDRHQCGIADPTPLALRPFAVKGSGASWLNPNNETAQIAIPDFEWLFAPLYLDRFFGDSDR